MTWFGFAVKPKIRKNTVTAQLLGRNGRTDEGVGGIGVGESHELALLRSRFGVKTK